MVRARETLLVVSLAAEKAMSDDNKLVRDPSIKVKTVGSSIVILIIGL